MWRDMASRSDTVSADDNTFTRTFRGDVASYVSTVIPKIKIVEAPCLEVCSDGSIMDLRGLAYGASTERRKTFLSPPAVDCTNRPRSERERDHSHIAHGSGSRSRVVSDKSNAHISGLTKADFEIQEDGKIKSVVMLDEIKTFNSRATRSARQPGIFSNSLGDNSSPKRLTIFALDLVNTPFLDQTFARQQLIKYLAKRMNSQEPSALLAIRANGLQVLHDFSSDPAVLVAALKKATGETSLIQGPNPNEPAAAVNTLRTTTSDTPFVADEINGEAQELMRLIGGNGLDAQVEIAKQAQAIQITLQAFQSVAEAFAGIPGRKSLVWVTAAFPFGLDAESGAMLSPRAYREGGLMNAPLSGDRRDQSGALPSFPSITEVLQSGELTRLQPIYQRTLQMLNDANLAVYPVDARGLVVFFPGADVSRIEGLNSFNDVLFEGSRDTMDNLAIMTGGHAFYNRNDLDVAFQSAADDSASYYMLGYYMDKNVKPSWHKLRVKVKRAGNEVRARSGFFVTAEAKQADTQRMDINLALMSPLDFTALPLSVRWTGVKSDGAKKRIHFEIDLPPISNVVDATKNTGS